MGSFHARLWGSFRGLALSAQVAIGTAAAAVLVLPFTAAGTGAADRAPSSVVRPTTTPEVIGDVASVAVTAIAPTTSSLIPGVPAKGDDMSVSRVIDGDTIVVSDGTRVRFIGIDTPETVDPSRPVQCFGPEATRYTNELLPVGTRIRLVYDVERLDRYGRTLAYVYKLTDGVFVNQSIARNGFALQLTVPPNVAHAEAFRVAVAEARSANLGLWRACQSTTTAAAVAAAPVAAAPVVAAPTTRATVAVTPTTVAGSSGCHPSYAGACVPTGFSDVDCGGGSGNGPGYISAKNFQVVGPDVYDLDADGDGIACESR